MFKHIDSLLGKHEAASDIMAELSQELKFDIVNLQQHTWIFLGAARKLPEHLMLLLKTAQERKKRNLKINMECRTLNERGYSINENSHIILCFTPDRWEHNSEPFVEWMRYFTIPLEQLLLLCFYNEKEAETLASPIKYKEAEWQRIINGHQIKILPIIANDYIIDSLLDLLSYKSTFSSFSEKHIFNYINNVTMYLEGAAAAVRPNDSISVPIIRPIDFLYQMHNTLQSWEKASVAFNKLQQLIPNDSLPSQIHALEQLSKDSIDKINDIKLHMNHTSSLISDTPISKYQERLKRICGFYKNLKSKLDKEKLFEQKDDLERRIPDDCLDKMTFIVIGPFSSGKTTFLNNFLKMTVKDAFPTSGKPETATLNIITYAQDKASEKLSPRWKKSERFTFIQDQDNNQTRLRVHLAEIDAILRWHNNDELESHNIFRYKSKKTQEDLKVLSGNDIDFLKDMLKNKNEFIDSSSMTPGDPVQIDVKFKKPDPQIPNMNNINLKVG